MHLSIFAHNTAVALQHHSCIVIESCCTALEQRGDDYDTQFLGQCAIELRRRTRYRLCLIEHVNALRLAEIKAVMQFLQHYQFCTLGSQSADTLTKSLHIITSVSSVVLLNNSYFQFFHNSKQPIISFTDLHPCLSSQSLMPSRTFIVTVGSMKLAVPISIAVAPAIKNSMAS